MLAASAMTIPSPHDLGQRSRRRSARRALTLLVALSLATLAPACASDRPITESSLFGCWTPEGAASPKLCFGEADTPKPNAGASAFAWWDNPAGEPTYAREFDVVVSDHVLVLDLDDSPFVRCAKLAFEGDTLMLSPFEDADGECDPKVESATPTDAWVELE